MQKMTRLSGRLYFFPAVLPLIELVPWLLALLGAVSGVAGFSGKAFWCKHRKTIIGLGLLCLIAAGATALSLQPAREVRIEGTRLIPAEELAKPMHLGQNSAAGPAERSTFDRLWTRTLTKQVLSTPVIAGTVLAYGSYSGSVEALSLKDGGPLWSLPQAGPVFSLSAGADGLIYAGEGLHHTKTAALSVIDAASGTLRWRREFSGHLEEQITLDPQEQKLWLGSGPGGLWALDATNGAILWRREIGHIDAKPLLAQGRLYVSAQPSEARYGTSFYALSARTGKTLWSLELPGQPWGSPLIEQAATGPRILTSTGKGQIGLTRPTDAGWAQAISPQGKLLWQTTLPDMPLQPAILLEQAGLVIIAVKSGKVIALRTADGAVVWESEAGKELQAPATLIAGLSTPLIATTSHDGLLSIFDALTGDLLARRSVGTRATSAPVAFGDTLYVATAYSISAFGGLHSLAEHN